jgi:hypothetical protein
VGQWYELRVCSELNSLLELKLNIQDEISMFSFAFRIFQAYSAVMVIVGNKVDKAEKSRQIRSDMGKEYALSVGATFIECSAKTKEGMCLMCGVGCAKSCY